MRPLVSVIIPAYNSEQFIEETLTSVLNQTMRDLEVLVIDDGSTDRQKDVINKFCGEDSRFKYFYQPNQGVSAARNYGIEMSSGEFIAFLDSDDIWLPDNLRLKLLKFQSGSFRVVHSDAALIDENSIPNGVIVRGKEGWLLNELLAWKETIIPGPSSLIVRRDLIKETGKFDLNLSTSADQDFFFRIAHLSSIGRVEEVTWRYRIHQNNMHKNIKNMEKDVLYVYNKANVNGLFFNAFFARKCFANMYMILCASWAGDGHNINRAMLFGAKAILTNPFIIGRLAKGILKKWLK